MDEGKIITTICEYSKKVTEDPNFPTVEEIYDKLPATRCRNCGNCCTTPYMSSYEYHYIIDYICRHFTPKQNLQFYERVLNFEKRRIIGVGNIPGYKCAFRNNDDDFCEIYPARSLLCRTVGILDVKMPNDCTTVELIEGQLIPMEDLKVYIKRIEDISAKTMVDDNIIPLHLPIEIWIRVPVFGFQEAMNLYFNSPFHKTLKTITESMPLPT